MNDEAAIAGKFVDAANIYAGHRSFPTLRKASSCDPVSANYLLY